MSNELNRLHRLTRLRLGYDRKQEAWRAFHAYADALAARLPFRWHAVLCDNPTQNHTGTTNGAVHIVLDEPFAQGRWARKAGESLCGNDTPNLWAEIASGPSCKRCLEFAERVMGVR